MRYTGASVGYQLAAALGAGLSPMIASALILVPGVGSYLIGGVWALFAVVGAIAVMASRRFAEIDPKPEVPSVESDIEPLAHADGK